MSEKELKRYFKDIKSCLLCGTKQTKRFLAELSASIDAYIEENNVTEFRAVEEHFGSPEQIAKAFFAEADIADIRKKVRIRRLLTGVLIAALLIWGVFVGYNVIEAYLCNRGYGEESIIVLNPGEEASTRPGEIIIQGDSA